MSKTDTDRIQAYYRTLNEQNRLDTAKGSIEFTRTLEILEQRLEPESEILDLGCGTGRYAEELKRRGHRVTLVDLSIDLLHLAIESLPGAPTIQASATELPLTEKAFDAVLALGPFYHLRGSEERESAASEISRLLRSGGQLFCAFVPRLSGIVGLIDRAVSRPGQVDASTMADAIETGEFVNLKKSGFQEGFFATRQEISDLFERHDIRNVTQISLKGIAFGRAEEILAIRESNPELYDTLMDFLKSTEEDPSVIDFGEHALHIGKKL